MKTSKFWGIVVTFFAVAVFSAHSLKAAVPDALSPEQFGSLLTLDEAVARALKNHAEVKRAFARLHKEESLYKGALAEFFPKLSGEITSAFATGGKSFVNYVDTGIEQPIFQGGKAVAQKQKQKAIVESEELRLEQAKVAVEASVRVLYAEVLAEKELTRIAQGEVKELTVEYERIKKLVDREILPRYEFFRIETLFQGAKQALVKHKETCDYLLSVLKETIGIGEGESLDLEPLGDFSELSDGANTYLTTAREHDPVYKLKDLKIREKQFEKKELVADRYPHLSLSAKWNEASDVFVDTNRVMVGLVGKWNIWDFGRLGSKIKAKSHEIEEMKWEGELQVKKHEQGIREAFHEARAVREKIRLTEALIREREEIYKNEKTRLIAGEKGTGELIDSFIALEEAKIKNVQSVTEYRVLLVKLEKKADFETTPQSSESEALVPPSDSEGVEE
ncbi:MAG TPA: TolC family protein [Candidatus Omnitrophota bacterium]|nr:TolC family protein [Candidatus Omnitrophota bacterium]